MDHLLVAIDGDGALADQHLHAVFFVKAFAHQRQLFGGVVREVGGKVYAIVSDAWLFAKYGDFELVFVCFIQQIFDEPVADHAIADDGKFDSAHYCLKILVS